MKGLCKTPAAAIAAAILAGAGAAALAAAPLAFAGYVQHVEGDVSDSRQNFPLRVARGETVDLSIDFLDSGAPLDISGAAVTLHTRTNGMDAAESWQTSGTATNNSALFVLDVDAVLPLAAGQWSCVASRDGRTLARLGGPAYVRGTAAASIAADPRSALAAYWTSNETARAIAGAIAGIPPPPPETDPTVPAWAKEPAPPAESDPVWMADRAAYATTNYVADAVAEAAQFKEWFPGGEAKGISDCTPNLKFDWAHADEANHTVEVLPFSITSDPTKDNSDKAGRVVIPPYVDHAGTRYTVVGVAEGYDRTANESLTAIVAPTTVASIGEEAFAMCANLSSVAFPAATNVGDYAFVQCRDLAAVALPAATSIGMGAFTECDALAAVSLPTVSDIGESAFAYCSNLASVALPTATSFADYVFTDCSALASVDFGPDARTSVPALGDDAFSSLSGHTCRIIVPDGNYAAWIADPDWAALASMGYEFVRWSDTRPAAKGWVDSGLAAVSDDVAAAATAATNYTDAAIAAIDIPDPDYSQSNAELVATIEAVAPAPGDYAAVSNAAMSAVQPGDFPAIESDPVWDGEKANYATKTEVQTVEASVNLVAMMVQGSNVVAEVTNYNSRVHAPALRLLQLNESNEYFQVWAETNGLARVALAATNHADAVSADALAAATNYAAPRAWSRTTSGLGADAPVGYTWMSTPRTVLAGGLEFEKHATANGAIWILASNGMAADFHAQTNNTAFLDLSSADGTPVFRVEKTDSFLVGVDTTSVSVDGDTLVCGVSAVADTHPLVRVKASLADPEWAKEEDGIPASLATVAWSGSAGAWVCSVTKTHPGPSIFATMGYLQEGGTKIINSAPLDVSQGILCTDGVHRVRPVWSNGAVTWEVMQ